VILFSLQSQFEFLNCLNPTGSVVAHCTGGTYPV
jgi:hypothetical protein